MSPEKRPPERKEMGVERPVNSVRAVASGIVKSLKGPTRAEAEEIIHAREESRKAGYDWVDGPETQEAERVLEKRESGEAKGAKYPSAIAGPEPIGIGVVMKAIVAIAILVVLLGLFRII